MQDFIPYGVVATEYILPAAALISCGAKLHDYKETHEEPCIRMALKRNGKTVELTLFQFQEFTSKGESTRKLLAACKQLDFGVPCSLDEKHALRTALKVLNKRHELHLLFQETMGKPIKSHLLDKLMVHNTKVAATLSCLGYPILEALHLSEKSVGFVFDDSKEIPALVAAFNKPWGQYDFHEDHPLYHMKGALENRETLIILLKRASTRVEIKHSGKRFFLPLNASKEKLAHMIDRLNQ